MVVMVFLYLVSNLQQDFDPSIEVSRNVIRMNVSECKCSKIVRMSEPSQNETIIDANDEVVTCSKDVKALGQGQKVVSYTFFQGPTFDILKRDYFSGIRNGLMTMSKSDCWGFERENAHKVEVYSDLDVYLFISRVCRWMNCNRNTENRSYLLIV